MATVPTAITLERDQWSFSSPGAATGSISPQPIQRLIYTDETVVPAKGAADESFVTITAILAAKYFYRVVSMQVFVASGAANVFADWEPAMAVSISENGVEAFHFGLYNNLLLYQGPVAPAGEAFKIDQSSVANDFGEYFSPAIPVSQWLIDAAKGSSQIVAKWLDNSGDTTLATTVITRFEVDQFTPVQANAAPMNSSLLTYR